MSDFETVMEQIGFGRIHFRAIIGNGLLQMATITETMGMAIVALGAVCDLRMNFLQCATVTIAGFMGIVSSSYFWGYLTDKFGRRWILLRTIILSNVVSVISMFSTSVTSFCVLRFVSGVLLAGPSFAAITYLSEFCHRKILVRTIPLMYMFTGFAMLWSPSWATLLMVQPGMDYHLQLFGDLIWRPWRTVGLLLLLPGFIAFFVLLSLPESPKFLFMVGDTKRAMAAMNWMSKKNTGHPLTDEQTALMLNYQKYARLKIPKMNSYSAFLETLLNDVMPLFRPPFRNKYLCSCFVMFTLGLICNGLGLWYTGIRNQVNMRPGDLSDMTLCQKLVEPFKGEMVADDYDDDNDLDMTCNDSFDGFLHSIYLGLTYLILYNIFCVLLRLVRNKSLFIGALIISTLSGLSLIFLKDPTLQLFALMFFLAMPGVVVSLMGGALVNFVPTHIRAKAMCICLMWARFGAVCGSLHVGFLIEHHCVASLAVFALFPFLALCLVGYVPL